MEEPVLKKLLNNIPQVGKVEWIGLRPGPKKDVNVVKSVQAQVGKGLIGDRFKSDYSSKREVTLIQQEHLMTVASVLGKPAVSPELTRRNIVVRGINLLSLKNQRFVIGGAVLETTGLCHPCSRMEENLGAGGYNAMRGHGGITARVVKDGDIKLGDEVYLEGSLVDVPSEGSSS